MGSIFPSNLDGLVTKAEVMFCDFLGWIIKETHPQRTLLGHLLLEHSPFPQEPPMRERCQLVRRQRQQRGCAMGLRWGFT